MALNWLITGCSSGFGRALTLAALDRGDRVMATARRPSDLAFPGDQVRTFPLDVTDPDAPQRAVDATVDAFGRLDVVVNNAGFATVGAVEETTMDELRETMEVMFFGAVAVTKAAVPVLRAQGRGAIVQISSMGGQLSFAGVGAYSAAKFALEGLSEALAAELAPHGVRVMIVEPGAFRTELNGSRMIAAAPLDAYRDTAGVTRENLAADDGKQPGDPAKAARIIVDLVHGDEAPLRLPLGRDAVDALRAHRTRLADDLARWEHLSVATAH
ncbi:SDR family NAD(P)-dependent oxidoreductase [Cryptosporangium phraense]|uniref:SDR family NAD(P)-dependent oxidoreductase n=1 Tax=Cryptosporangium phraense TaxID=2593070 RepID=A0A545AGP4_9ACTN|nr:SDR family NAD(P)-dependent oxidoreductase [Cryptosporangium phraense]TQS40474.1 SDR family NAD(P)-dependent oxidoreductase [Cryptosporangium phraense]